MAKLKEVTYANLHASVFIPVPKGSNLTGGTFGPTLDFSAQSRLEKMYLSDEGYLQVETRKTIREKSVTFLIPVTNVTHMVLKTEEAPKGLNVVEKDSKDRAGNV